MTIWAIFLCYAGGSCNPVPKPGSATDSAPYYSTKAACESDMLKWYGGGWNGTSHGLDAKGRYQMGGGMYYVCLSRHVDTWGDQ